MRRGRGRGAGGELQFPGAGRHRRRKSRSSPRDRGVQGSRRQARAAAPRERTLSFEPDETRGRAVEGLPAESPAFESESRVSEQRRCKNRKRSGSDQGRAGAPGVLAGALGRDHSADGRGRRHAYRRMRTRQGAGRDDQAHQPRSAVHRPGGPRLAGAGAAGDQGDMTMLEGKVALVTGASRGIGKAIAAELAGHGARVIGTATSEAGAKTIEGIGKVLDVRDAAQCDALVESIQKEFGDILILVNNAGITRDNLALRMKDAEWDDVIATNLRAVFRLSRAVMRGMMKARWGRIVNITSVVGASGNPGQANYAAAKAGVAGMTRSLAREVGSRGITVNCVAPGFIDTDMTRALPQEQRTALLERVPLGRLGTPEDVAAAVAYLVSPGGGYVTGAVLHVNGGMYMS